MKIYVGHSVRCGAFLILTTKNKQVMECIYCKSECIRKGKRKGIQRYQCKECGRNFQEEYVKHKILEWKYLLIRILNNEGCSISSISRILGIAKSSVQIIICKIAGRIPVIKVEEENQIYEIDELHTFCGNKQHESWVMYAINKTTGKVIDFCVGRRTKENLKKITDSLLLLNPKKIYTDGLTIYKTLIPEKLHKMFAHCTNKIERKNLNIRTHLKRLSRKTICFTRSNEMLENCLRMYFV